MKVAVIMGSTSDLPKVEPAIQILKDYGVEVQVRCLSAHRAHLGLSEFMKEINQNGTEVVITAAGMAAALPGVVASQTVLPVIGVPLSGATLDVWTLCCQLSKCLLVSQLQQSLLMEVKMQLI